MERKRVLIVAAPPALRLGIRGVFGADERFEVAAEAANALEATVIAALHEPALVVLDDALPGVRGLLVARMLHDQCPAARLVLLVEEIDDELTVAAVAGGVAALLPAAVEPRTLLAVAHEVAAGQRPIDRLVLGRPALTARLVDEVRAASVGLSIEPGAPRGDRLAGREIAILDGVVRGMSNKEIADRLFVVEQTVKNQMTVVLRKLNAVDRTTAVVSAIKSGCLRAQDLPRPGFPSLPSVA